MKACFRGNVLVETQTDLIFVTIKVVLAGCDALELLFEESKRETSCEILSSGSSNHGNLDWHSCWQQRYRYTHVFATIFIILVWWKCLELVLWSEQPSTPEYLSIFTDYTWGNFFSQEAHIFFQCPHLGYFLCMLSPPAGSACVRLSGAKFEKWSRAERMDILLARYILKQSEVWWMVLNGWCTAGMEGLFGEAWVREMHLINQRD